MDMDILQDYLTEARELMEKAQEDTLRLESDPGNDNILASVFRAFHTLKGGAGFLDAQNLVHWTHHLEDLLDKLRSHALPVTSIMVDAILRGLDVIDEMLRQLAQGQEPLPGPTDLGQTIVDLAAGRGVNAASAPAAKPIQPSQDLACATPTGTIRAEQKTHADGTLGVYVEHVQHNTTPSGTHDAITDAEFEATLDALYGAQAPGMQDSPCASSNDISDDEFEHLLDSMYHGGAPGLAPSTQPAPAVASAPTANAPVNKTAATPEAAETTLRVDAVRLDALMNQVGEMVLLRNRLVSAVGTLNQENEDMTRIAREMDLTVNDLQSTVMRLRMQPCKRLFQQLPRVVRDASRQLGKEVRLEIVGEEVEIDKTVVDALSGPMTHLIRNSLDHGIELPADRQAKGKPREALIRVAAIHLGDKVRIEVKDDGKGIDRQFVTQKAIDKGVITREQAARLSEQEAIELIFRPGFSTKDQATDLSGRGVGMDVVKETSRKLRGRLDVQTRLGQGTTIAMEFPLTMAVLPVLYLRLRRDIYAMPVSAIESLTDVEETRIHRLAGRVVYRVNEHLVVPLVDLGDLLQNKPLRIGAEPIEGVLSDKGLFIVSEVLGNEDSVVKPIDFLTEQIWYQGATISGRGNVVLILDPTVLTEHAVQIMEGVNAHTDGQGDM